MSRFLVNNFCTYCSNFERNPSLKYVKEKNERGDRSSQFHNSERSSETVTLTIKRRFELQEGKSIC